MGKGDVCEYKGSAGCGVSDLTHPRCVCDIEFTYCTQTSLGKKVGKSLKSRGKNEFYLQMKVIYYLSSQTKPPPQ